ncbi:MAG: hypothetical protein ACUVXF_03700 [Desulfobaccales bacterium]
MGVGEGGGSADPPALVRDGSRVALTSREGDRAAVYLCQKLPLLKQQMKQILELK